MMWLSWRQFRAQAAVAVIAIGLVAVALGITDAPGAINDNGFFSHHHLLQFFDTALLAVPAFIGAFWGAPLIAREMETGTWRLAWTQSVTRAHWLTIKVGLVGLAGVAVTGLFTLMLTLWSSRAFNMDRFSSGMFGERGIAPMGYAAFAFALGVTAGLVIRRTVPAMAATLVAFLAARIIVAEWVRPHFAAPFTVSQSLASQGNGGGLQAVSGQWVISDSVVGTGGHVVDNVRCGIRVANASRVPSRSAVHAATQHCLAGYRQVLTYQPAGRYWPFQVYETALFTGVALILIGFCFWWTRHRLG